MSSIKKKRTKELFMSDIYLMVFSKKSSEVFSLNLGKLLGLRCAGVRR